MTQEHLLWLHNYLQEIYKTPILENLLNLQIVELEEGTAAYNIKVDAKHSNIYGFVHGGTLATICDVAMGVSCVTLGKRVVTLDMNISYIKNVPVGSTISAVGKVISNGNTIMRAAGEVYCGQELLVRAQASYYVTGDFCENDFTGLK